MGDLKEEVLKMREEVVEIEKQEESWAMALLKDYKKINEGMFKIIIVLIVCWLLTIGGIIFYSCLSSEETTQEANREQITQEVNK